MGKNLDLKAYFLGYMTKKILETYLKIIQDTCHGIGSRFKNKHLINFGDACTYSMHPLKNLNVWGDGGFIVTQKEKLAKKLSLIRNHGLKNMVLSLIEVSKNGWFTIPMI